MKYIIIIFLTNFFFCSHAQVTYLPTQKIKHPRDIKLTRELLTPVRLVYSSDSSGNSVVNPNALMNPGIGQATIDTFPHFKLRSNATDFPLVILDFGKEIQGGLQVVSTKNNDKKMGRLRLRFGESVSETLSNKGENGASNDHSLRDFVVQLPWLGKLEVGNTGFRFVSVQLVDPNIELEIAEIGAIFSHQDIPSLGSFKCSDDLLNQIWETGAYTVYLNMQNYLWDGIKRDRLIWVGDMHPEVMTINSVFGYNETVPKSLDLIRDLTPLPKWMNGISSYSLWWILIQRAWYYYQGDLDYLKKQQSYLVALLHRLASNIDNDGKEILDGVRFLDWPSSENEKAIHAGLQSLMVLAFEAGGDLCRILGDDNNQRFCITTTKKLKQYIPEMGDSKQAAALLSLAGLVSPERACSILNEEGVNRMSTFYGYYMLQALAKGGNYEQAMEYIRQYWGGMLDLGATTFWEDFNIDWMKNAARIDELVTAGKVDVHATYGDYCYKGFRHSFCHGWASGPTAWLTEYVLGVHVIDPGCKVIRVEPRLGNLLWVDGTFPTPYGIVKIRHEKKPDGKIESKIESPEDIRIILDNKGS